MKRSKFITFIISIFFLLFIGCSEPAPTNVTSGLIQGEGNDGWAVDRAGDAVFNEVKIRSDNSSIGDGAVFEDITVNGTLTMNGGDITNAGGDYLIDANGITISDNFEITNTTGDFLINQDGIVLGRGSASTTNAASFEISGLEVASIFYAASAPFSGLALTCDDGIDFQPGGTASPSTGFVKIMGELVAEGDVDVQGTLFVENELGSPLSLKNYTRTQILNLSSPQEGQILYSTTIQDPVFYDGNDWRSIIDGDTI